MLGEMQNHVVVRKNEMLAQLILVYHDFCWRNVATKAIVV